MKLRVKIALAQLLLFSIIVLLGSVGIYYLQWLAKDAHNIIQDNYATLTYMHDLDDELDEIQHILLTHQNGEDSTQELQTVFSEFEKALNDQLQNITEPGEQQLSEKLMTDFKKLKKRITSFREGEQRIAYFQTEVQPLIFDLEEQISRIYQLNEETILRKNEKANNTARKVIFYMTVSFATGVLLGLLYTWWLPAYISRPIKDFNKAIKQIAKGNYHHKLPVNSADEFGGIAISFNKMAAKLREYEQSNLSELLFEKKRLDAVINQMSEAIIGLDENKYIIFANTFALSLLGLKKEEVVGRYAPDVATTNSLMHNLIGELMIDFEEWEEKKFRPVNIVVNKKERLYAKNIVDIVEQLAGETRKMLIGHVIILTDITEFAEKDIAKTHFIATLSHELKTPVAAIEMSTELLTNAKIGHLNQEQQELMDTIRDNNVRIKRTIHEILDMSKIESGTIDIYHTEEDPSMLVDKAIEGIKLFLHDKNLKVEEEMPSDLPAIHVDAHKTVWILNNFLTNAIRYAPVGSSIQVKAFKQDTSVTISVSDQGPGISKEDQQRIFKKFSRLKGENSEGTGLGLAISKEFIESMGGMIGVSSKEGNGAEFWISAPAV